MARAFDGIDDKLSGWLADQRVFFVATAPLADDGRLNLSPKGIEGTFVVVDPHTVAYLDLTGSGIETVAHLRENGRIVVMFCAFEGPPRIVRLYGRGEAILPDDPRFGALVGRFTHHPGIRSVVVVEVTDVTDSCGFGVPVLRYDHERTKLDEWAARKGPDGIAEYQHARNAESLDGLPGLV